jgi:protein-disulfide isomerase
MALQTTGSFLLRIALILMLAACVGWSVALTAQAAPQCMRGKSDAPVRLEVFSDYECPSCAAYYLQTMQSVFKDYAETGKVCVIYRDFPLKVHAHALEAAHFAKAAMRLGPQLGEKVAETLFKGQVKWSKDGDLDGVLAASLDAQEMDTLRQALDDNTLYDAIGDDVTDGLQQGISDAPTIVISGKGETQIVQGALRYSALKPRLDTALGE